jgi:molybdate transport system regulatory protein
MENNKVSSKVKAKSVKESHDLAVKLHMWLEKDGGVFFGSGRYELLKKIDELGCLKSASESLGLSYRGAWGKLKRTEEIIGEKLVYKKNNKEGYMLTDLGRNLMDEFGSFFEDVSQYASKKGTEIVKKLL